MADDWHATHLRIHARRNASLQHATIIFERCPEVANLRDNSKHPLNADGNTFYWSPTEATSWYGSVDMPCPIKKY